MTVRMHKPTQPLNSATAIETHAAVAFSPALIAGTSFAPPGATRQNQRALESDQECAWFARCTNPATQTAVHPDQGQRPICDRCVGLIQTASRMVELSNGGIPHHQSPPRAAGLGAAVRRARAAGAVRKRSAVAGTSFVRPSPAG
jgi:hypothetical protein